MADLVIVESPGKTKKISAILGSGFRVQASLGHVRDLPESPWSREDRSEGEFADAVGLSLDGEWTPTWEILKKKRDTVDRLVSLGSRGTVWLATDLDREGEAIAWHLRELLGGDVRRFRRVTFSEITEDAIRRAFSAPRELDMELVHAYLARRFLDRVVGYTVSPLLSSKLYAGVSAGRVQSAALGILVDRDEQIRVFEAKQFFGVDLPLPVAAEGDDQPVAQVVDAKGAVRRFGLEEEARAVADDVSSSVVKVTSVESARQKVNPQPPFTTSTLQQAASSRLKLSVGDTMAVAQKLYEAGAITYMRSDAVFLAPESIKAARDYLQTVLGPESVPEVAPEYSAKAGAQEAHEAIRPSNPAVGQDDLGIEGAEAALYALIRARLLASQMNPAIVERTEWRLAGGDGGAVSLAVKGRVVIDPGWHRVLPPVSSGDEPAVLPKVEEDQYPVWQAGRLKAEVAASWTKPPKRYTEAALVSELEAKGVGRPSTYAATLEKLLSRGYVFLEKRLFIVAPFGRVVDHHLRRNFPRVRDVTYTSKMEEALDKVAQGDVSYTMLLDRYWEGLSSELQAAARDPDLVAAPRPVIADARCPQCGYQVFAWIRKGVFRAICRSRSCGFDEEFKWAPKRPPRRKKGKESVDKAAAEDAAAEQRGGGRCPECKGVLQRWKAGPFGFLDACGQWPLCGHLMFGGGGASPKKGAPARGRSSKPKGGGKSGRRTSGGSRRRVS